MPRHRKLTDKSSIRDEKKQAKPATQVVTTALQQIPKRRQMAGSAPGSAFPFFQGLADLAKKPHAQPVKPPVEIKKPLPVADFKFEGNLLRSDFNQSYDAHGAAVSYARSFKNKMAKIGTSRIVVNTPKGPTPTIGTRITMSEYVTTLQSTPGGAFAVKSFPLDPSNTNSFPYLSQFAQMFDQYVIVKLRAEFRTNTGTSTVGRVALMFDYDPLDAAPVSILQGYDTDATVTCPPYGNANGKPVTLSYNTKRAQQDLYYTNPEAAAAGSSDPRLQFPAVLHAMTTGGIDSAVWGELWFHYDYVFVSPRIETNLSTSVVYAYNDFSGKTFSDLVDAAITKGPMPLDARANASPPAALAHGGPPGAYTAFGFVVPTITRLDPFGVKSYVTNGGIFTYSLYLGVIGGEPIDGVIGSYWNNNSTNITDVRTGGLPLQLCYYLVNTGWTPRSIVASAVVSIAPGSYATQPTFGLFFSTPPTVTFHDIIATVTRNGPYIAPTAGSLAVRPASDLKANDATPKPKQLERDDKTNTLETPALAQVATRVDDNKHVKIVNTDDFVIVPAVRPQASTPPAPPRQNMPPVTETGNNKPTAAVNLLPPPH